jgi:hypothetical protein
MTDKAAHGSMPEIAEDVTGKRKRRRVTEAEAPKPTPGEGEGAFFARFHAGMADVDGFERSDVRSAAARRAFREAVPLREEVVDLPGRGESRADLPQIDDDMAFVDWLNDRGVAVEAVAIPARSLSAAQGEAEMDKVEALRKDPGALRKRIFASGDGVVVDGHHRWLANKAERGDDALVLVWRVTRPFTEVVNAARAWPGVRHRDVSAK